MATAATTVKRDNHAVLAGRRADDHRVLPAAKVFVEHRVNVVAASGEDVDGAALAREEIFPLPA